MIFSFSFFLGGEKWLFLMKKLGFWLLTLEYAQCHSFVLIDSWQRRIGVFFFGTTGWIRDFVMEFVRCFNEWKLESVRLYLYINIIYSNIRGGGAWDQLKWKPKGNVKFDIKFYHEALHGSNDARVLWKSQWCTKILKGVFFSPVGQQPRREKWDWIIPTKREINLVNQCCMSRCFSKTVDNLLIHCLDPWAFVLAIFCVQLVMNMRVIVFYLGGVILKS